MEANTASRLLPALALGLRFLPLVGVISASMRLTST